MDDGSYPFNSGIQQDMIHHPKASQKDMPKETGDWAVPPTGNSASLSDLPWALRTFKRDFQAKVKAKQVQPAWQSWPKAK